MKPGTFRLIGVGLSRREIRFVQRIAQHNGVEPLSEEDATALTLALLETKEDEITHDSLIEKGIVHYWDDGENPISKLTGYGFKIYQIIKKEELNEHAH